MPNRIEEIDALFRELLDRLADLRTGRTGWKEEKAMWETRFAEVWNRAQERGPAYVAFDQIATVPVTGIRRSDEAVPRCDSVLDPPASEGILSVRCGLPAGHSDAVHFYSDGVRTTTWDIRGYYTISNPTTGTISRVMSGLCGIPHPPTGRLCVRPLGHTGIHETETFENGRRYVWNSLMSRSVPPPHCDSIDPITEAECREPIGHDGPHRSARDAHGFFAMWGDDELALAT